MAEMQSRASESQKNQTTVLAGPGRNVSLTSCAHQIMAEAGSLTCLLETKLAFLSDVGHPVLVKLDQELRSITLLSEAPEQAKWLVVEYFADGAEPRASAFRTKATAAANFGVKLVMQRGGAVTVKHQGPSGEPTISYTGEGNSGIAGMIMTPLSENGTVGRSA